MILIALGANLPSRYGDPEDTLEAAIQALAVEGVEVLESSGIWLTAPVPVSNQPWYRNAVVSVKTELSARVLMRCLQQIEENFGRKRSVRNASRVIDLDILAYDDEILDEPDCIVPHPRMEGRAFVLMPLREVAPTWRHPLTGVSIQKLIENLPQGQHIEISKNRAA